MNRNNEQIYKMVENTTAKVVGVATKTAQTAKKVGYNRRGGAVGVLSAWFFAKLFYPSGLPP